MMQTPWGRGDCKCRIRVFRDLWSQRPVCQFTVALSGSLRNVSGVTARPWIGLLLFAAT
jgi:hypothetical protein